MDAHKPTLPYADRRGGGRALAHSLQAYANRDDVLVLGLPRGGVEVAEPVAETLNAPLDVLMVRKLGVPGREELAFGAVATGDTRFLHDAVIDNFAIAPDTIERITTRERAELQRRQRLYRGDRAEPRFTGRCLILVDDGLATGSTMHAAGQAVRRAHPSRVVVAVPVAPNDTLMRIQAEVDDLVCPAVPEPFYGVGQWYTQFDQTTDQQVSEILQRAWQRTETKHKHSA